VYYAWANGAMDASRSPQRCKMARWLAVLALGAWAASCSLNPQPEPPGMNETAPSGGIGGGLTGTGGAAGTRADGGTSGTGGAAGSAYTGLDGSSGTGGGSAAGGSPSVDAASDAPGDAVHDAPEEGPSPDAPADAAVEASDDGG
jgi:hypothetical protein